MYLVLSAGTLTDSYVFMSDVFMSIGVLTSSGMSMSIS